MRRMFRDLCLIGLLAGPGLALAAEGPSAEELLRAHLEGAERLHASFTQDLLEPDGTVSQTSHGEVWVYRPDRFRWVYREPFEQVIVADGERVWMYDPELEQVTVKPIDETLATSPALLLSGSADLEEAFEVTDAGSPGDGDGNSDGSALRWVALTPRVGDSDFRRILLAFRDGSLERLELTDALDQTTVIYLESVEEGVPAPEGTFEFQVPEGADVIGAQPEDDAPEEGPGDTDQGA